MSIRLACYGRVITSVKPLYRWFSIRAVWIIMAQIKTRGDVSWSLKHETILKLGLERTRA